MAVEILSLLYVLLADYLTGLIKNPEHVPQCYAADFLKARGNSGSRSICAN